MPQEYRTPEDGLSLRELFSQLTRDMAVLLRRELSIAKAEMSEKASRLGKDVAMIALGGLVAYAGVFGVLAAIALLLIRAGLPAWGAAMLVGVVVSGTGAYMLSQGVKALKSEDLAPQQTIKAIEEDTRWLKEQTS